MSRLKVCKLGDVIKFGNGKSRPASEGIYPIYGGNGILGYTGETNYEGETLIIGRVGAYCGATYYEDRPIWVSDNALSAKPKNDNNAKYLYFFLKNMDLNQHSEGSSHPLVTHTLLNSIDIEIATDPNEQKSIAAVLSSLDDKIYLLHRQNATLEAMAETLFQQWFIVEAKEDWVEKTLDELVKVIDNRGKTPPYQDSSTPYPIIEVNALTGRNRLVDYSAIRKYVSEDTFNTWFRGHPKKFDSLISTVGSIGEISMFLIERGSIAQNVIALRAINISPIYLFEFLKHSKDEIKGLDIGSVQPSIKVPHLLSIKIMIPPADKLKSFDMQVERYLEKMLMNYKQIRTLEKLRNTLLPKLMSGEVRVRL